MSPATDRQKDPHFQALGAEYLGMVDIHISESPCGPIHVLGFGTHGRESYKLPHKGSAILLTVLPTTVEWTDVQAYLTGGCYGCIPGGAVVSHGRGLLIHTPEYKGLTQLGGPVEEAGRLKYINGCSDSLLIMPALYGEPCLNLLHLPEKIDQTRHTHPSDRIGIIIRGKGECRTPVGGYPLLPGSFWRIPAGGEHSFFTAPGETLDVFAWHPDSEFGPTHDSHPMLTRTIVEGVGVHDERHRGIRTTEIRVR